MRRGLRVLGLSLLILAGGLALVVAFGPRHATAPRLPIDAAAIAADPAGYLARAEAALPDITPGAEKRIRWAGQPGRRTRLALLYVHGFSATAQEIRPVPDRLAAALGANLHFARLTGHGRTGEALGAATATDWQRDLDEAMAVARAIGERVVIVASSTGATLVTTRLTDPAIADGLVGVVFLSPNYRVRNRAALLLDWPWAAIWGPWVAGPTHGFEPANADQARFWTTRYPLRAAIPMAALIRAARRTDPGAIAVPALFVFSDADTVVDAVAIRDVAARWGGPLERMLVAPGPGTDPAAHVLAGDILSPAQTDAVTSGIIDWARRVAGAP
ncbi:MAG: alpha/beta hydrolase [Rhodobacteraceae bacterium]|jgi:alpha-beta hydrolase superfamily lysophospholipase|nr:alpha/beta hydrolase [Paracoccaceae bacterium]